MIEIPIYVSYQFLRNYVYIIDERLNNTVILTGAPVYFWRLLDLGYPSEQIINYFKKEYSSYNDQIIQNTYETLVQEFLKRELILC